LEIVSSPHQTAAVKKLPLRLAAVVVALLCRQASAATFSIADGDVAGLKAAITAANSNNEDDTINLAAGGTYTLTAADNSAGGSNGLPVIGADNALGTAHTLTINGNGATIERSTVSGTPDFRIFYLAGGTGVTISRLTIANAEVSGDFPANSGGGIFNDHGKLVVDNCAFNQNVATVGVGGAGIFNYGANSGGATLSIIGSTFTRNSAPHGSGGAINNYGEGGSATLNITNSTFGENNGFNGGAIYNDGLNGNAMLSVTNCTFSQNSSTDGGGIFSEGHNGSARLSIVNSTLSQNSASVVGGGIYSDGYFGTATLVVTNCTFSLNSANVGGGIYNTSGATLQIGNTILESGMPQENQNIVNESATVTSLGYNLSNDGGDGFLNATGDQVNTDPLLDPAGLKDNGGPTQTIALQQGSPAIDKGKDIGPDGNPTGQDQRGAARPARQVGTTRASGGDYSDIGAFEIHAHPIVVTTNADEDDGTPDPNVGAGTSLREAINAANNQSEAIIAFDPMVFAAATAPHVIDLLSALPNLSSNITIQGPGANVLTVERSHADGTPDFRIFTVSNGTRSGPTVTISGLSIANGLPADNGGGILNDHGTLTVESCAFGHNSASSGGGIYNDSSFGIATLSIIRSTFSHNSAGRIGGGIFSSGDHGSATLTITNSTLSQNSADLGGGIYNFGGHGGATISITNSTFSENSANYLGGGIFNFGDSGSVRLYITNSTFSQNVANSQGGGIYNDGASGSAALTITNATFSENSAGNSGGGIYNDGTAFGSATLRIGNTILNTGPSGENIFNNSGTVTSLGYNLSNRPAGGDLTTGPGGFLNATGDQRNTDPKLDPAGLRDNGGPTPTIALKSGSPAIDKGKDNPGGTPTGQDQRGSRRPVVNSGIDPPTGGDHSDIGAFELAATFRGEKQDVLALVRSLIPSGNSETDKALQQAATKIAHSVDPKLWVDDFHPGKKSGTIFKQEKDAAQSLLKVIAANRGVAAKAQEAIDDLVEVDREIAQLALDEAVAGGGDPKVLANANNEMSKARQALAAGRPGDAIDHYGKAWQDAVNARRART
jgi:CSLREA domain-containing protein